MSISSIGSIPMTNVSYASAPVAAKPAAVAESSFSFGSDGMGMTVANESQAPSRAAMMQAMQSDVPTADMPVQPQAEESATPTQAQGLQKFDPSSISDSDYESAVAHYCSDVARMDLPIEERTEFISDALTQCIETNHCITPNEEWTKATPEQIKLFVQETLEHTDAMRAIGTLRGMDYHDHDLEPHTGKFEPRIAQYMALPGREDSVKWAIKEHNASPHHAIWCDPNAKTEDLAESASDIVNAWRMNRRVYQKPSWSWDRIADFIQDKFNSNEMSVNQRDALLEAIPFQMEYENKFGLPA